jgi:micrococcal nuclease
MKRRTRLAAAVLACSALTLGGCTADESYWDANPPSATENPTPTPGTTENPDPGHADPAPTSEPDPGWSDPHPYELATVSRVVDGDTLHATLGNGEDVTVRVVGIDTPETKHPSKGVECYGPEASAEADLVLAGNDVHLVYDRTQGDKVDEAGRPLDKYDRVLAFVEMAYGGGDFGAYMIDAGFARAYAYDGHSRATEYAELETTSRAALRGLWGACQ